MPTLLLSFANNETDRLRTLAKECKEVNDALRNRHAKKDFEVISESMATREFIVDNIRAHENDLSLFLFSGHAGRDNLLFEDGEANSEGIAEMLGRCKNLKLVILNGCSTAGQVESLLRHGVSAVVATSAPIGDEKATLFSITFFEELSQHNQSIENAFERAINSAKVFGQIEQVEITRGLGKEKENKAAVWGLYYNTESSLKWHLPNRSTDNDEIKNIKPLTWAVISGIAFIVFLATTVLFGMYNEKISLINPSEYFFLLIPLALVACFALFGALRSYAKYSGDSINGAIQLSGPVVLFVFILWIGNEYKPQEKSLSFTVNIFSKKDSTEAIQSGEIKLFYGQASHVKQISEGQSNFNEVPSEYKGKPLTLIANADGYFSKKQNIIINYENATANLYLDKKPDTVLISGLVTNRQGKPVKNAILIFANGIAKDTSDSFGNFMTVLPFKDGAETMLRVYTNSSLRFNNIVTLSATIPLTVQLH